MRQAQEMPGFVGDDSVQIETSRRRIAYGEVFDGGVDLHVRVEDLARPRVERDRGQTERVVRIGMRPDVVAENDQVLVRTRAVVFDERALGGAFVDSFDRRVASRIASRAAPRVEGRSDDLRRILERYLRARILVDAVTDACVLPVEKLRVA